ncbi:G1 family endopeptidase [Streptomyces cocklensis]|uniref:Peptidase A4 family protein n=1 Tax=Actinacidiphila cocklensis TaxID=887465 RepID=A0A9W4DXV3_9ACTN|nr:G1 family glutamic endopeptidase [Actinacidiphila cocklensis]MDD1059918.1 G1 family endopeptidase [Actinacidiphila cocklensis]WSX72779.1 G1 family endopeptidase [Streptomyces sp. NBC_00899]WSX81153.1 G1 family endopeptidase [Streptomyces sp. NBC_00899]CAG6395867.1 Peptidase A4 family protein [Actinacidiphila cocklensis]
MRRFLTRVAPVAVAALALAAPAVPAGAAAAPGLSFRPLHYNINGYNWGGYAATGSGFTSVSAAWTEANATCNSTDDLYAPWVGIDGYGSSTVEQTGVATDCSSGSPVHQAWYEMYPANPVYLSRSSYPVSAGDHITASVTYAGSSKYTLKLTDSSRGWTYTTSKSLSSQRASAEVIIESPTGAYPNFGTLNFTSATVNGSSLGSFGPVALDPSNGAYEARTGALGSGGTSFSETYLRE